MESKKLELAILEIVSRMFEAKGLDLSNSNEITRVGKKCIEVSKRQLEFIVKEYFDTMNSESNPISLEEASSANHLAQVKKYLDNIDNTLNSYFSNQEYIENSFNLQSLSGKLPPSIIEKLVVKLDGMSKYEPEFILNIRDISLEAWKETLEFEKILTNERKRFETFTVKLDCKWRNRHELVKQKTGVKILKLEQEIEKINFERKIMRERLLMSIEDLVARLGVKERAEEEMNALIKKNGFKDIKAVLNGIKKIEAIKSKCQGQVENAQKETKMTKGKLATSMSKQEEYRKQAERFESLAKELGDTLMKAIEFTNFNTNEKNNIGVCITESNFTKLAEILKSNEEIKDKEEKVSERNNSKAMTRNSSELKSFSPRKEVTKTSRQSVENAKIKRMPSKKKIEEPSAPNSSLQVSEKNSTYPNTTQNDIPHEKKSSRIVKKNSNSSKIIIPTIKEEEHTEKSLNLETEYETSQKEIISLKRIEEFDKKQIENTEEPNKKLNPINQPEKELSKVPKLASIQTKSNNIVKKHRYSLEPPPIEKEIFGSPKTQPPALYLNEKSNSLGSTISHLFSNQILKKTYKNPEPSSENLELLSLINHKNIRELLTIQMNLNGEKKTLEELFIEYVQSLLRYEKNEAGWENTIPEEQQTPKSLSDFYHDPSQNKSNVINKAHKEKKSVEVPQKVNWKNATLRLFVLLEEYLDILEISQEKTATDVILARISEKKEDSIVNYILKSSNIDKEISEISLLINRQRKYDLLFKILGISKSKPYHDWKSDRINIINKVRWANLLGKIRGKEGNKLQVLNRNNGLYYKISIEGLQRRNKLITVESLEKFNKSHRHNFSMENIAIAELKASHERGNSFNRRGLNYFLPELQCTPRVTDKSFQLLSSNFMHSDLWVRNNNKNL